MVIMAAYRPLCRMSKPPNPHEWMRISAGRCLSLDWTSARVKAHGETEGVEDQRKRQLNFLIRHEREKHDREPINKVLSRQLNSSQGRWEINCDRFGIRHSRGKS